MKEIAKAVIQKDEKILLLRRSINSKTFPDAWDFAGGKHDPGETSRDAVIREVKEETSFDIDPGEEIKTIPYEDDQYNTVFHYYTPKSVIGELKIGPEHSEYRWVDREEIQKLTLHRSVSLFFDI